MDTDFHVREPISICEHKGSLTNDVIGLWGSGFQIMTGEGGFAEDDVIFYNHFRANFGQFYYNIFIKVNQNLKKYINHKRAIIEIKRIILRDRSYLT